MQPGHVLLADLLDVAHLHDAPQPCPVGAGIVDRRRAAVGVHDHHRAARQPRDDRFERCRERLEHEPERPHVQGADLGGSAASAASGVRPGAAVPAA